MVLGTRQKPAKSGENREICEVQDCVVFVPILKTLERLLENEDVVTQVNTQYSALLIMTEFVANLSYSTDLQRALKPAARCY